MRYIEDKNEADELMQAINKIKSWAMEQMGSMRMPKSEESDNIESSEPMPEQSPEECPEESEMEHEEMMPVKEEKTIIAMGPKYKPSKPEGIPEDISQKLEKYGRKRR